MGDDEKAARLAYYTLDFGEEPAALSSAVLWDQAEFINDALTSVRILHADEATGELPRVTVVAHSMGAVAARGAVLLANHVPFSISSLVTLTAPHQKAPVSVDWSVADYYWHVNAAWREASNRVELGLPGPSLDNIIGELALVSIDAGPRDILVSAPTTAIDGIVPAGSGFHTSALDIPGVELSTDHQAALWCNQLVKAVSRAIAATVARCDASGAECTASERRDLLEEKVMGGSPVAAARPDEAVLAAQLQLPLPHLASVVMPSLVLDAGAFVATLLFVLLMATSRLLDIVAVPARSNAGVTGASDASPSVRSAPSDVVSVVAHVLWPREHLAALMTPFAARSTRVEPGWWQYASRFGVGAAALAFAAATLPGVRGLVPQPVEHLLPAAVQPAALILGYVVSMGLAGAVCAVAVLVSSRIGHIGRRCCPRYEQVQSQPAGTATHNGNAHPRRRRRMRCGVEAAAAGIAGFVAFLFGLHMLLGISQHLALFGALRALHVLMSILCVATAVGVIAAIFSTVVPESSVADAADGQKEARDEGALRSTTPVLYPEHLDGAWLVSARTGASALQLILLVVVLLASVTYVGSALQSVLWWQRGGDWELPISDPAPPNLLASLGVSPTWTAAYRTVFLLLPCAALVVSVLLRRCQGRAAPAVESLLQAATLSPARRARGESSGLSARAAALQRNRAVQYALVALACWSLVLVPAAAYRAQEIVATAIAVVLLARRPWRARSEPAKLD